MGDDAASAAQQQRIAALLDEARGGRRAAIARLLSLVERGGPDARTVGRLAHPLGGTAYTVGITGAPGSGKSTLTNALCTHARTESDLERLAVLAIDPSSPFSGGAILGDRIRMGDQTLDEGIYIRSMATRGHLGGLALATPSAIRVLDAVGFPVVVVETVGVGQVEVEIVASADTCVVVLNPGWGDAIQANKAGLMEIGCLRGEQGRSGRSDRDGFRRRTDAESAARGRLAPASGVHRFHVGGGGGGAVGCHLGASPPPGARR